MSINCSQREELILKAFTKMLTDVLRKQKGFIMARQIESKERSCIREVVSIFGCVRLKALTEYVELINRTKFSASQLVDSVASHSMMKRFSVQHIPMVKNNPSTELDIVSADAFEVYILLLKESVNPAEEASSLKISRGRYPYNYVATVGNQTNMILMYDHEGLRRLVHYNRSEDSSIEDPHQTIILTLPSGYDQKHMAGAKIKGQYRVAITRINTANHEIQCLISALYGAVKKNQ